MSRSRSDEAESPAEGTLRPADHADSAASADITQPALGAVGWLRWGWRQLTSMRTALVLLLLLAIAAVPGSIVPQRSADPNGVSQYFADNPDLAPILDNLQLFDVYTSIWFSSIYILLFISLIGCVIPRTKHHWKALRARPPRTPARLERLADFRADDDRAAERRRCRCVRGHRGRCGRRAAAARRLPRRAVRRARHPVGVGGARLRARDRKPRVPHRPHRRARRRRRRRWVHLHRPGRDHRGRHVRQHDARLHLVQPGALRRRGDPHAVRAHARRVRRDLCSRAGAGRRAGRRLRRAADDPARRRRAGVGGGAREPSARDRR